MDRREGGCRCGRLRFAVTLPPLVTIACHYKGCQQMTASAFSLSAAIPTKGFEVLGGEAVPGGLQQPPLSHAFCPSCKSWVFTQMEGLDAFVNVRTTLLDDPGDWTTPFVETYTCEKLPWVETPAVHRFERFPPTEVWADLTTLYAEHREKPSV